MDYFLIMFMPFNRSYNPPKPIVTVENADRRRSPMRPYSSRRRKFPAFKSGKRIQKIDYLDNSN